MSYLWDAMSYLWAQAEKGVFSFPLQLLDLSSFRPAADCSLGGLELGCQVAA